MLSSFLSRCSKVSNRRSCRRSAASSPPQRLAPGREERRQNLGILPSLLAGLNLPQAKPHIPQRRDPPSHRQLVLAVITIAGGGINGCRGQQTNLVIVAQHADADPGQLGKFSDFQHCFVLTDLFWLCTNTE